MEKKHKITKVLADSIAWELGIQAGDFLVSVNGETVEDIFDYQFLVNDEEIIILIEKPDGEEWEFEIEKEYDEELGLEFEEGLMDEYKSCRNKCIFCFNIYTIAWCIQINIFSIINYFYFNSFFILFCNHMVII